MTDTLQSLRDAHESARLSLETAEATRLLSLVEQDARLVPGALRESWNAWDSYIDPHEMRRDEEELGWRRLGGGRGDSIEDRKGGKDAVVFETEQDLSDIRGQTRVLATRFSSGISINSNLTNYVIGTGLDYDVQPAEGQSPPQGLLEAVARCLNTFLDDNDWPGDLEREIHERTRTDGEAFVWLRPDGWRVRARIVEPVQVTEPRDPSDLEGWLGCQEEYCSCWTFGVHTKHNDPTAPIGYHAIFDGTGNDWEYIPAAQMEHLKRNTPRNVKRGVSDFYPAIEFLKRAEKLLTNTTEGAAVQAAIAFIRKHAAGTTSSQVQSMRTSLAYDTYTQPLPTGGSRTQYVQKFLPGSIIDTGQKDYAEGPGAKNAAGFVTVIQAALRYVGIRWSMPEYIISGDASNNNFASSLVAEAPFVKSCQADQAFYVSRFKRVAWKVLRIAFDAGYFNAFALDWPELEALIEVEITAPEVATRDQDAETNRNKVLHDAGVLSKPTWAAKAGLDFEEEQSKGAKEVAPPGAGFPGMTPTMEGFCPTGKDGGVKNDCGGEGGGGKKLYRGRGRDSREAIYKHGGSAVFGEDAAYYATSPEDASQFGPDVTEHSVDLSKPLTISSDNDWHSIAKAAGVRPDLGLKTFNKNFMAEQKQRLLSWIVANGHDGVDIQNVTSNRGLGRIFGIDQVVKLPDKITESIPPDMLRAAAVLLQESYPAPLGGGRPVMEGFCPTGDGGGVKNDCGKGEGGGKDDDLEKLTMRVGGVGSEASASRPSGKAKSSGAKKSNDPREVGHGEGGGEKKTGGKKADAPREITERGRNLAREHHGENPAVPGKVLSGQLSEMGMTTNVSPNTPNVVMVQRKNSTVVSALVEKGWKHEAFQLINGRRADALSKGSYRLSVEEETPRTSTVIATGRHAMSESLSDSTAVEGFCLT